ncbi:MAG: hypothetical protein H7270_15600 [Dermatophilaceae bacterium]|nr:hypothetical protein [Dermatophilaceae bacterium]
MVEVSDGVAFGLWGGVLVAVGTGVVTAVGAGVVAAASEVVILVIRLASHDTTDPPGFPVPLHWLTLTGIARLTFDAGSTAQSTVPAPPLAEPLHWVTVAAPAVAGKGVHRVLAGTPEPTHWLVLALVRGFAFGVPALMLLVMRTSQLIVCAASLSELLHCCTVLTTELERVVNVPFGVEQGPSVHSRVTVVVELLVGPSIVLTTVTVHLIPVEAPSAFGPCPLHWSTTIVEARAMSGMNTPARENTPVSTTNAINTVQHTGREAEVGAGIAAVLMLPTL